MPDIDKIKNPIGVYQPQPFSEVQRDAWIQDIVLLPMQLEQAIAGLTEEKLKTPYREGGWTLGQIIHHLADANLNGYLRYKFGFTETEPTIKPFQQNLWIATYEVGNLPPRFSIDILKALHIRWAAFLRQLTTEDWQRKVVHPEYAEKITLWYLLGLYSWHPRHHTAQILEARKNLSF